jgi:purine-binding chemotaxis protein CheW
MSTAREQVLIFRTGSHLWALPVGSVVETMRPLPIQPLPDAPPAVLGVALIRGTPTPVVDARAALATEPAAAAPTRFVTLDLGARSVALAVDAVIGVRALPAAAMHAPPPVLEGDRGPVAALGTADAELLVVLRSAQLVPEDVAAYLDARGGDA